MGTVSVWHLLILLMVIGIPLGAVALEGSGRRDSRRTWAMWVVGYIVGAPVLSGILAALLGETGGLVFLVAALVYAFLFYQALARRARDAGHGKTLAYVAVIPLLNIAITLYLLFKPSEIAAAAAPA